MAETIYLDFDLSLEQVGENAYRARVVDSPAGIAKAEFSLPFSPLEIENFILKVSRTRRAVRRIESPELEAAKNFGGKLFKAVFSDEVQSALRSSLDQAQSQGVGLRIRLRLTDAPNLVDLPWEYLYNPPLNRFLALSVNTPVVRFMELPERIRPFSVQPPLRVLVMIANPKDYPALDVEREWQNLKEAVSDLEARGMLILERLQASTSLALQYRLRRSVYHIFHFIGHGGFDEHAQDGVLMLESQDGLGHPISGQSLGTILHDEDSLRLVILNACEGARTGKTDPFAGAAQSLVQQGLPSVIAMQFEVSDQAAITFAREFYSALADGLPVDASLSEARKVIFSSGNEIEWGTPVLYLRAPDGQIFDIDRSTVAVQGGESPSSSRSPSDSQANFSIDQLYVDALSAFYVEDYEKAVELFQQVAGIRPNYLDADEKLIESQRRMEQVSLRRDVEQRMQAGEWKDVLRLLEKLANQSSQDKDIPQLLALARKNVQLEELYALAVKLINSGQWSLAKNRLDELQVMEPGYRDVSRLLQRAESLIEPQTVIPVTDEAALSGADKPNLTLQLEAAPYLEAQEPAFTLEAPWHNWAAAIISASKSVRSLLDRFTPHLSNADQGLLIAALGWGLVWAVMLPLVDSAGYGSRPVWSGFMSGLLCGLLLWAAAYFAGFTHKGMDAVAMGLVWAFAWVPFFMPYNAGAIDDSMTAFLVDMVIGLPSLAILGALGSGLVLKIGRPVLKWKAISSLVLVWAGIFATVFIVFGIVNMIAENVLYKPLPFGLINLAAGIVCAAWGGGQTFRILHQALPETISRPLPKLPVGLAGARVKIRARLQKVISDSRFSSMMALVVATLGWLVAWVLLLFWANNYFDDNVSWLIRYSFAAGLAAGLGTALALRIRRITRTGWAIFLSSLVWAASWVLAVAGLHWLIGANYDNLGLNILLLLLITLSAVAPGSFGFLTVLRRTHSGLGWSNGIRMAVGWLLGLGVQIGFIFIYNQLYQTSPDQTFLIFSGGLAGLIGAVWLFWVLRRIQ